MTAETVKVAGGGEAVVLRYDRSWGGADPIKGRGIIYLHSPGHIAMIDISTLDDAESERLLTQVLGSLTATP